MLRSDSSSGSPRRRRSHITLPDRLWLRIPQLFVGLFVAGFGLGFMVVGALGVAPWDVLSLGLLNHIPVSFGTMTVLMSGVVLLLWIPLREKPGPGTVLNALLIGPSADVALAVLPEPQALWVQALFFAIGLCCFALGSGMYLGVGFGAGPRDGLMTGLHRKFGLPIWVARTGLEVSVVTVGWLLGGTVGIGTLLFALLIGPMCQFTIRVFTLRPRVVS